LLNTTPWSQCLPPITFRCRRPESTAVLKEEIQRILLSPMTLIAPVPQIAQVAPVMVQSTVQPPVPLLPPIDSQPPP
uniref:Uncharacterized protein n=1 Tax=Romanomermis culicivorax TaxID=13658 RepID=A0A915HGL2_ROMCU